MIPIQTLENILITAAQNNHKYEELKLSFATFKIEYSKLHQIWQINLITEGIGRYNFDLEDVLEYPFLLRAVLTDPDVVRGWFEMDRDQSLKQDDLLKYYLDNKPEKAFGLPDKLVDSKSNKIKATTTEENFKNILNKGIK